jgi:hypothetical protein
MSNKVGDIMKKLSITFIVILVSTWIAKSPNSLFDENDASSVAKLSILPKSGSNEIQATASRVELSDRKAEDLDKETLSQDKYLNVARQRELVDYSGDWCTLGQLSQRDQSYAQAELEDWKVSVGRFAFNVPTEFGYQGYDNSYVANPYLEISKDDLMAYIEDDEPIAMFAALDRYDIELREQFEIAKQLLVLGYTGKAIQHLVIHEMTQASVKYDTDSSTITDRVKQHLSNALTYATYSLRNYDSIGFIQLSNNIETNPKFEEHLNPALVLSEGDIAAISDNAKQISGWVKSTRFEKGLPPLDRELSKIAKHELDRDIGMLYGKEPIFMQILNQNFGDELPQLETNDCRIRHSQVFARR